MNEEQIIKWMKKRITNRNFTDAAGLAREFLQEHEITDTLDPDFSRTINAGFKVANDIASC